MTEKARFPDDPLTATFWESVGRHELLLQRCASCGTHHFYPRRFCLTCLSSDVHWVRSAGTGTVYSMTRVRVQIAPEFDPPYIVALIEIDEGPRLLSNLVNGDIEIGDRVQVMWQERDGHTLPVFEPEREEHGTT